jgi:hypothetical protein
MNIKNMLNIRCALGWLTLLVLGVCQDVLACGGFFCQLLPVNQAGEQIVFRQDGSETTAMIKINYVGAADKFGWVLPVPSTPEISLGNDSIFTALETSTRPQFVLDQAGTPCPGPVASPASSSSSASSASSASSSSSGAVVIEKQLDVGPFNAQVISSDDPEALAVWLKNNNLDLTEGGSKLLAPYTQVKSKFVVLKLINNVSIGSIRPIILKYASNVPVIPMTLTAVAAQNDMGVLVWTLGNGRGVPKNYKHVIPNYTHLNWFNGTRNAYISYQGLITRAMNEAGGQGFATDFAGYMPELINQLPTSETWKRQLKDSEGLSDASFIQQWWQRGSAAAQDAIRTALPTSSSFVYSQPTSLVELFTQKQLKDARALVVKTVQEQEIDSIDNSRNILDDGLYLTRLYTTLSADEMGVNPEFTYNTAMENQPLVRRALLTAACKNQKTEWTLKLGAGTGREDEMVIEAWQDIPFNAVPNTQAANWKVEKTSATADPVVLAENKFQILSLGTRPVEEPPKRTGGNLDAWFLILLSIIASFSAFFRLRKYKCYS